MTVQFSLPLPPSANQLWRSPPGSRRPIKSREYRVWLDVAALEVRRQHVPITTGKIRVTYEVGRKDKRRRDLGNNEKALSDLLTLAGVIEDDSLIDELRLVWRVGGDVLVTVESMPAEAAAA